MSEDSPPRLLAGGSEPATPEQLLARLESLGLSVETVSHRPVFTVEEAKRYRDPLVGAHVKNLFVRDKKGIMWLVVTLEHRTVDLHAVAARLGLKRLSFASERRMTERLGVRPGSVTPFALLNDHERKVSLALDVGLKEYDVWNFHPLVNTMTTTIQAADMLHFLDEIDHPPRWISVEG